MKHSENSIFADNYAEKTRANDEVNSEIKCIIDNEIKKHVLKTGEKPTVLDVGSAGLYLYNPDNIKQITMLDIFPKPDNIKLTDNTEWLVGNILADDIKKALPNREYDFIIMSSLLHHLCDANNKIIEHLRIAFSNSRGLLRGGGELLIFESTCPTLFCKIQDILYPFYSYFLVKLIKFAYVRMTCIKEILRILEESNFQADLMHIKQPKYICMLFLKIPLKLTPLKINAIIAYPKEHY